MFLADGGDAAEPGGASKSPSATAQAPNRFTSAPGVCQSDLLGKARVEALVSHPKTGVMVNTGSVVRCEWETESRYIVSSELHACARHGP